MHAHFTYARRNSIFLFFFFSARSLHIVPCVSFSSREKFANSPRIVWIFCTVFRTEARSRDLVGGTKLELLLFNGGEFHELLFRWLSRDDRSCFFFIFFFVFSLFFPLSLVILVSTEFIISLLSLSQYSSFFLFFTQIIFDIFNVTCHNFNGRFIEFQKKEISRISQFLLFVLIVNFNDSRRPGKSECATFCLSRHAKI